jgi:hypothetical protein
MSLLGYRGGMNSGSACVMNLWMERFRPAFYSSSDRRPVSPTVGRVAVSDRRVEESSQLKWGTIDTNPVVWGSSTDHH